MHFISNLFYREKRLISLSLVLIIISGISATFNLPRQEDPSIAEAFGNVTTFLPGASALRVESLLSIPLERAILGVEEIKEYRSFSKQGVSILDIELQDWVKKGETDLAWTKVREALAAAELPAGATQPDLRPNNLQLHAVILGIVSDGLNEGEFDATTLKTQVRLAEDLSDLLSTVPGTFRVETFGDPEEELLVEVSPAQLLEKELSFDQVANALKAHETRLPTGVIVETEAYTAIELEDRPHYIEHIRDTAINANIRLENVATISHTFVDPLDKLALVDGLQAVVVGTRVRPERRVDYWTEDVLKQVEVFRESMPSGYSLQVLFKQSEYVDQRLNGLAQNLGISVLIVVGILIIILGLRSAAIVGLALPLTIFSALAMMIPAGITLHQMSVIGIVISLGLLIDNPIVVVERFQMLRFMGHSSFDSFKSTVSHLWSPLIASTLTTALAFMPIAVSEGRTSEFVGTMATMVIISLSLSFFFALTIILVLAENYLKFSESKIPLLNQGIHIPALANLYRKSLQLTLRRPILGIALGLLIPITGYMLIPSMPKNFFPPVSRNMFEMQISMPVSTSLESVRQQALAVRKFLKQYPEVESNHWFLGGSSPRVFYNSINNNNTDPNEAIAFFTTTSADATAELLPRLQKDLRVAFPGTRITANPFGQGPPVNAPVEIRIIGENLDIIRTLGTEVRRRLGDIPHVTYSSALLESVNPVVQLHPKKSELGIFSTSESAISRSLSEGLNGLIVGSLSEGEKQIPIRARIEKSRFDSSALLSTLARPLQTAGSGLALTDFQIVPKTGLVARNEGERFNLVQAWIEPFVLPSIANNALQTSLINDPLDVPRGYKVQSGGESETAAESINSLLSTALFFVTLIFATIVVSMRSYYVALVMFAIAVLAGGLAMFGIKLSGEPLGFIGIVGSVGLIGLSINGGIIVMSALMQDAEEVPGADSLSGPHEPTAHQALEKRVDVVVAATRHIVGTTLTTIGGFIPLILFGETFWLPLAWVMVGGVVGSAILALYFVPSSYVLLKNALNRRGVSSNYA